MNKLLILLLIFSFACAPKTFKPLEYPEVKFEKTEEYHIDLDKIHKPERMVPQFAYINGNSIQFTDKSNASHIILVPEEYAKVAEVVNLAITYKNIVVEQEKLINNYIAEINSLKELLAIQQEIGKQYRIMWVNSENMYRQEQYEHKKDNLINKISYVVTVGGILLVAIAL